MNAYQNDGETDKCEKLETGKSKQPDTYSYWRFATNYEGGSKIISDKNEKWLLS